MQPSFVFRHIESTDGLEEHATEKLHKLENFWRKPESLHVILAVDNHEHKAEITLVDAGAHFVGHGASADMYVSIDQAVMKLKHQLQKRKDQVVHKKGRLSTPELVS